MSDNRLVSDRVSFRRRNWSPWTSIVLRVCIAGGALLATALIVYLDHTGYHDNVDDKVSFLDALYYATVSLSTTGFGDIYPESDFARLLNTILVTPLRFIFLSVLVSTTVEVLTQRGRAALRLARWSKHVNNHVVVVGFGVTGRSAVRTLLDSHVPANDIVVVCDDPKAVAEVTRLGCVSVIGDAHLEEVLRDAITQRARLVIVAVGSDERAVLVTLAVRRVTMTARVVVAVREAVNAAALRQSGADGLITTAESAGQMLATSGLSPDTGAIFDDLMDPAEGLRVSEREVTTDEVGKQTSELIDSGDLVLAVYRRGERLSFDDPRARILEQGDVIIVVRSA